ncbi:MAG: DUF3810 domain-containing protein [Butyrivibrio sp.]|nr:DUF3810 domain-containing protein [Butyrivibrio sp.]
MRRKVFASIFILTIVLNILSIVSTGFADFYTRYIFPIWERIMGGITSPMPFSFGEWMIIAGLLWLLVLLISFIVFCVKKNRFFVGFGRATIDLLIIIALVMTLNCFINYHTTPIGEEMTKEAGGEKRQYTVSELAEYRDFVVTRCNELAEKMDRDENGFVRYAGTDDVDTVNALMAKEAKKSMAGLSDRFPKLSGYYVNAKPLLFSGFISQQYMQGYYFPFSMEANYNNVMYVMNKPFTMCHELSHTKSYIMEDEANFLAYLGCTNSEDEVFEYSGYIGILNYVNNEFYNNVTKEEYESHVKLSDKVKTDNIFLTKESWDKVEENAVLSTETVKQAADTFVDTTLKVNGIDDGIASYSRVVELLLMDYYK